MMKNFPLILLFLLFLISCNSHTNNSSVQTPATATATVNDLQGAWEATFTNSNGQETKAVMVLMDGYMSKTYFNPDWKRFDNTYGGPWKTEGNTLSLNTTFSSAEQPGINKTLNLPFTLNGDTLKLQGDKYNWIRLDKGSKNALAGAWFITGRMQNGEIKRREVGARKTLKILSDTRFQWVAFNEETGGFFGTGGGTYTASNGYYTENIDFFSRDSSRVGASLSFNFELKNKEWHHSGLSSKGDSIYEIWTPKAMVLGE